MVQKAKQKLKQTSNNLIDKLPQEHVSFLKKWSRLGVIALALAIIIIDTTLLNVSLGTIIRELHTNIQSIQWVITAYALVLSAFTITGGRLGDLFGRKRMFILGAILFALGSLLASVAHSVGILLLGESIIEGIGAALMMPAAAALLLSNFTGRDRAIAFGVFGGVAGAASAVGPILGGWLTSNYSWRWGFRINVFVVILLLIGSVILRETRDTEEKPQLDVVGVLLSALGMFSLVFGIIESSNHGWWKATSAFSVVGHTINFLSYSVTVPAVLIGLAFLTLFWLWEKRMDRIDRTPLVSPRLFANKQYSSGLVTLTMVSLGLTGMIFALPVFFQGVLGRDAFHTGTAMLPLSIGLFIGGPISAVLSKWFTPKRIIQTGLVLTIIGLALLHTALAPGVSVFALTVPFMLVAVGMGFNQAQISNLTLSGVSVQEAGEASGVMNTSRQIGSTLGSAIIGTALLATLGSHLVSGIASSSQLPESAKPTITSAVQAQSANVEFGGGAQIADQSIPAHITQEIKRISNQATTDGVRYATLFSTGFLFLALIASTLLPNIKNVDTAQSAAHKH